MLDPETIGTGIAALLLGIGGTLKAKSRAAGNGHISRNEWDTVRDVVRGLGYSQKATDANVARIEFTLARHDAKLDGIQGDIATLLAGRFPFG